MNEKVLNTLEFHKITQILSSYAGSEPAKNMCLKLRPSSNMNWITKAQGETEAALSRLLRDDRISFGSNKDIRMLMMIFNHSEEAVTLRYIGVTEEEKKESMKSMGLGIIDE